MISAIAETGNMTKAAQKLFVSQSALSQQLKDIESKLRIDLFYRTRKRMILTPIGKKLLATAQGVIEAVEDAELEIAKMVSGDCGELKVGTHCIFCFKWLPHVMGAFQKKFPNIEVEIGTSIDFAQELETRKFDFVITAAAAKDEDYDYMPLFEDQLVCILPADHPFSNRSCIQFEDFSRLNLITHAEKGLNRFYQLVLKPRGIEPQRFMVVGQPHAIVEMVSSGFGISIFPRWAIKSYLNTEGIVTRPLTKKGFPLTWSAAFLKNRQLPAFQKKFIQIVRMNLNILNNRIL